MPVDDQYKRQKRLMIVPRNTINLLSELNMGTRSVLFDPSGTKSKLRVEPNLAGAAVSSKTEKPREGAGARRAGPSDRMNGTGDSRGKVEAYLVGVHAAGSARSHLLDTPAQGCGCFRSREGQRPAGGKTR